MFILFNHLNLFINIYYQIIFLVYLLYKIFLNLPFAFLLDNQSFKNLKFIIIYNRTEIYININLKFLKRVKNYFSSKIYI